MVTATVPDATTAFHLHAIQRNGDIVSLWVDGVKIGERSRPNNPTHNASSFFSPLGQMGGLRAATSVVVNEYLNPVELAGGTLSNMGAAQVITANSIASLTLTADAQVNAQGTVSIAASGMGPSSLDLGGHTLTVNVADNQVFRLMNCTATNGTVRVVGNNTKACFTFNETSCRASTVDFDLTCTLAPYVPTTVHDLILRSDCVYQTVTPGVTSVAGTFTTFTKKFQNIQMLDGSTLDLTNWTEAFSTTSELQDRSLVFAPNARVTVDVHGRELSPGQQLIAWTERPLSTSFRLDAVSAAQHGVVAQAKGLFVATGTLIIVR